MAAGLLLGGQSPTPTGLRNFTWLASAPPQPMEQIYSPQRGNALYANLVNAPPMLLFHEAHRPFIEHPADLLHQELDDIANLFVQVADAVTTGPADGFEAPVLAETEQLIRTVNELYEQLHVIIKCFSAPDADSEKMTLHDFLKTRNPHVHQAFLSSTKAHHEQVRIPANALKHRAARLAPISITNHNGVLVTGFYVRTMTGPEDQRGPDPKVHARYRGTVYTAFSYNHFLLRIAGMLYLFLDKLDRALFKQRSPARVPLPPLERVLRRASEIRVEFFPDEYDQATARISATEGRISIRYPQLPRIRPGEAPDHIMSVNARIGNVGRPVSQVHALIPYLQLTRRGEVLPGLLPDPRRRPRP